MPKAEIDFVSDAVWKPGEGEDVRERDREVYEKRVKDLLRSEEHTSELQSPA